MQKIQLLLSVIYCCIASGLGAQNTVGLIQQTPEAFGEGYLLFAPIRSKNTYLINSCGEKVQTWTSNYEPGQSCYLLEDGTLLRTGNTNNTTFNAGGKGGIIEKIDWTGNVVWSYQVSDATKCQHHDVKALPNGNILVIAWESKTNAEAVAQGRNPALTPASVWTEQIIELEPIGTNSANVVWEWHLWDHLVQEFDATKANYGLVSENPQLFNVNYVANATNSDWIHMNSIDYNPALDQILLSSHNFDEIWIIDHSTTTAEAASHSGGNSGNGGDILYRWGNPVAYNYGSATQFFGQHNARWIEPGFPFENQIMVFNNGNGRPGGNYSTIEIINPPVNGYTYIQSLPYLPATTSWIYNEGNSQSLFAQNISGAQPLMNGNVLFCEGPAGRFKEISSTGNALWEYVNPITNAGIANQGAFPNANMVFRCTYYAAGYSAFLGQTLVPQGIIENSNAVSDACSLILGVDSHVLQQDDVEIFPNPVEDQLTIHVGNIYTGDLRIDFIDMFGRELFSDTFQKGGDYLTLNLGAYPAGIYFVTIHASNQIWTRKISLK